MNLDLSLRLSEIIAGERRAASLPTLLVASLVTALVAIPLVLVTADADDVGAAPVEAPAPPLITVDLAGTDPLPLDGATLSGNALISISAPGITAASFSLFAAGAAEPMLSNQDLDGPVFSPVVNAEGAERPLDTTALANGFYELFIVMDSADGEERSAVGFEVANS